MPPIRRRGPYKRYLNDENIPVPKTTMWERRRAQHMPVAGNRNNEDQDNPPINLDDNHLDEELSDSDIEISTGGSTSNGGGSGTDTSNGGDSDTDTSNEARENWSFSVRSSSRSSASSNSNTDSENSMEEAEFEELPQEVNDVNYAQREQEDARRGAHLYDGCRMTAEESSVLIMSFVIRWGLEGKSIEDLLELINCHLPSSVLGSKYMFLKNFPVPDHRKIKYTCPQCCSLLPENGEENEFECDCGENINLADLKESDGNFFVQLSISKQLEKVMSNNKLRALMRKECEESDVIMGNVYRRLRENGVIGENDVRLQWNTDGLKPYKSAKCTAWPLQACINELGYHDRKENMILCGLYYGRKKPDINSFLTGMDNVM